MTLCQNCSNRSAPLNKMAARAKNRKTFKRLLLLNQKMDFEIIIQECFLGDPLPKLLKEFRYMTKMAARVLGLGYAPLKFSKEKSLLWLLLLNRLMEFLELK